MRHRAELRRAPESPTIYPPTDSNERQLRAALLGACKRMPGNPEAHFHIGLMYLRRADGEEALRAFQLARSIYERRMKRYTTSGAPVPDRLRRSIASLRAHVAQAAYLAVASRLSLSDRAPLLTRLQSDLVASTEIDPEQPAAWNALALLHLAEGGSSGARDMFTAIRAVYPNYADAVNNLALSELAEGRLDAAEAHLQRAIAMDPGHVEAITNYGTVLLLRGRYDLALSMYSQANSGEGGSHTATACALGGAAVAYVCLGRVEKVKQTLDEACRNAAPVDRCKFEMLSSSMAARRMLHDGPSTKSCAEPGVGGNPETDVEPAIDGADRQPRGTAQGETGIHDRSSNNHPNSQAAEGPGGSGGHGAIEPSTRARAPGTDVKADQTVETSVDDPSAVPSTAAGHAQSDGADLAVDEAVAKLRSIARDLRSADANCALGSLLRQCHAVTRSPQKDRNYASEAAERLVEALERNDADEAAWVQLALLQMDAGAYDSGSDLAGQAIKRNSDSIGAWCAQGICSSLTGNTSNALACFREATRSCSEKCRLLPRIEWGPDGFPVLATNSEHEKFRRHTRSVSSKLSPELEALLSGGADSDGLETANSDCKPTSSGCATHSRLRMVLAALLNDIGTVCRQAGERGKAKTAFEQSLSLGGDSAMTWNNLGVLNIATNSFEDAREALERAVAIDPTLDCAESNLIRLRKLLQQRPRTAEQASQLTP